MNSLRPKWIGAAVGSGSHDEGTRSAPYILKNHLPFHHIVTESPSGSKQEAERGLISFHLELAHATWMVCQSRHFPAVIGGDHSMAIGTWSGIAHFNQAPLGMLWIDAHMDAHTPETTESGNIHGMPLAALLGFGASHFTEIFHHLPKLIPEHTVLFGVRSYEAGEAALLRALKVRVYLMEEIQRRGFFPCWREAFLRASSAPHGFGISLDLDALDPQIIPGVGTPVHCGLLDSDVSMALHRALRHPSLKGFEIAEYNPNFDQNNLSLNFILETCSTLEQAFNRKAPAPSGPAPKLAPECRWAL